MSTTVLRYTFNDPQWLNKVSFDLKKVPCEYEVQYYHQSADVMLTMVDSEGGSISGVVPVESPTEEFSSFSFSTSLVRTTVIELHITRLPTEDNQSFSVGARRVNFEIETDQRGNLPPLENEQITLKSPLGHVERLTVTNWDASQAIDGNTDTFWKCEPQPVGEAVVPLFLDVRDSDGEPQTIDRLWLDPVYTGPKMNVYFSMDEAESDFFLLSQDLRTLTSNLDPALDGSLGTLFDTDHQYLYFDTNLEGMDLDGTRSWSIGLTYRPNFDSDSPPSDDPFLMTLNDLTGEPGLQFKYDSSEETFLVYYSTEGPDLVESDVVTFSAEDVVTPIFQYNGDTGTYSLRVYVNGVQDSYTTNAEDPFEFLRSEIRIGNSVSGGNPAEGHISHVWIRQDLVSEETEDSYLASPVLFMSNKGPIDPSRGDYNCLFQAALTAGYLARVGKDSHNYEAKVWKPVPRDFRLTGGMTHLPPTLAKYMKLEFTDLCPRPYPVWEEGIKRVVKTYPQWVTQWYKKVEEQVTQYRDLQIKDLSWDFQRPVKRWIPGRWEGAPGVQHSVRPGDTLWDLAQKYLGDPMRWREIYNRNAGQIADPHWIYPGQVFTIQDGTRYIDGYLSETYETDRAFWLDVTEVTKTKVEFVERVEQRRFYREVVHEYDLKEVTQVWQQAYFVGLREVKVYSLDYLTPDDTPEYLLTFNSEDYTDTSTWEWDGPGYPLRASSANQVWTSEKMESTSDFQTVQISVQGSAWESQMSDAQMSLVTDDHIDLFPDTESLEISQVLSGEGGGLVFQLTPTGANSYGMETQSGMFTVGGDPEAVYDVGTDLYDTVGSYDAGFPLNVDGARISAMSRFFCPETALGTYKLTLKSNGTEVKSKTIRPPRGEWVEISLVHLGGSGEGDYQVCISQEDTGVQEPFAVDFLGLFQHPLGIEVSNDDGSTWRACVSSEGDPHGYLSFPDPGNELRVKITSKRAGAVLDSILLIPHYIHSPEVVQVTYEQLNRLETVDPGLSLAPEDKPQFKKWSEPFPQRYSLRQAGRVPLQGEGLQI